MIVFLMIRQYLSIITLIGMFLTTIIPLNNAHSTEIAKDENNLTEILGPVNDNYLSRGNYRESKGKYYKTSLLLDYDPKLTKDMWRRTQADELIAELKKFKTVNGSPALRELWRQALLGGFDGISLGSNKKQKDIDLITTRMDTMIKLGLFHDVIRLYHAISESPIPEDIALRAIDAMSMAGMVDGACLEVKLAAQSIRSQKWLKKYALCATYFDEKQSAKSVHQYIKDNFAEDKIYLENYKLLGSQNGSFSIDIDQAPFIRALFLARGGYINASSLKDASPEDLAWIALSPDMTLKMRIMAAEKAVEIGSIGADALPYIYEKNVLTQGEIEQNRKQIINGGVVETNHAFNVTSQTYAPNIRAQLLRQILSKSKYKPSIKNRIWRPFISKLSQQIDLIPDFAPIGYVIAIWQDDYGAIKLFRPHVENLSALEKISELSLPNDEEINHLINYIKKQHPNSYQIRQNRLFSALKAIKLIKDSTIDPQTLNKWQKNELNTSSNQGIMFLQGLHALSQKKPGLTPPKNIHNIVKKYHKNHFFSEIRKIILEIMVQTVL